MKTLPPGARRIFALFFSLGLIYTAALCSNRSFAFSLDDFNDNVKDASKWGLDTIVGHGVLTEKNQRLEYTCSIPSIPEDDAIRPWVFTQFPYDTDWEIQMDTVNTTSPFTPFQVNSLGFTIQSPHNALDDVYLELYASDLGGGPPRTGFSAQLEINGVNQGGGDTGEALTTTGAVRMRWNSVTKVLTCFYDTNPADGYQWIELASFGLAGSGGTNANVDFAMTDTDQFSLTLYGFSAGMIVTSGQIFMDNFIETGGVVPSGPPSPVPVGSFHFGFPSNNPLLTAILDVTGNYRGVSPTSSNRNYNIDVAEDESGKCAVMGTMDGIKDANGNPEISVSAGAIATVNGEPTAQLNGSFTGTRDDVNTTFSGLAEGPVKAIDVGGGTQGVGGTGSYSSNIGGVPFAGTNLPIRVAAPPGALDNLKKDWSLRLDVRASAAKGKKGKGKSKGQLMSAELLLPNGDTIAYPGRTVKSSKKKAFTLSLTNGTNVSANPPAIDTKSSIMITGLQFVQQGGVWQPNAGIITYHFLGQQGTANLLDFVGP